MVVDRAGAGHPEPEVAAGLGRLQVQIIHDFDVVRNKPDRTKDDVADPLGLQFVQPCIDVGLEPGRAGVAAPALPVELPGADRPGRSETFRHAASICWTYGQRSATAVGMLCAVKISRAASRRSSGRVSRALRTWSAWASAKSGWSNQGSTHSTAGAASGPAASSTSLTAS